MKKFRLWPVLCLALWQVSLLSAQPLSSAPQPTLNLDFARALDLARRNNPEWKALETGPKAAAGDLVQAGMTPNPTVTLRSATELPISLEAAGLSVSQEFEMGNKRAARLALADARLKAAEFRARETQRQLRLQLQTDFTNSLYLQELGQVRQELLSLSEETLSLTRGRLKAGDVAAVDVMQLETEVARRRAAWQETVGRLRVARAGLARLLGEPAEVELRLEGQLGAQAALPALANLQQLALQRADLLAAQSELEAAGKDIELQRARGVSNWTASLGLARERLQIDGRAFRPQGVVDGLDRSQWSATLSLSVPLPLNDTNEGNIQKAQAQQENSLQQELTQRQKVQAEVAQAYYEWMAARQVADTLGNSAVERARSVMSLTNKAYNLGFKTLLNVLQVREDYINLQLQRLETLRAQELALAKLQAAIGGELP